MYLLADQSSNAKLSKNVNTTDKWQTSILYLSPADSSQLGVNLCPAASEGCRQACLNTAGRGAMSSVQMGRLRKTKLYVNDRFEFNRQLVADLETIARRQVRTGIKQAIRLNGTSDVRWELHEVLRGDTVFAGVPQAFPELQFYDYTKLPVRFGVPTNYHVTFSRSESNGRIVNLILAAQPDRNIAVVFHGEALPAEYLGRPVIDGTAHDMRFLDPVGCIVGLLTKGRARKDTSGFAVDLTQANEVAA